MPETFEGAFLFPALLYLNILSSAILSGRTKKYPFPIALNFFFQYYDTSNRPSYIQ